MSHQRRLRCGCCSSVFYPWEGYKDQGQDKGCGICYNCQQTIALLDLLQWLELFKSVEEAFQKPLNRFKFQHSTLEEKKYYCHRFMEENIIQFTWR